MVEIRNESNAPIIVFLYVPDKQALQQFTVMHKSMNGRCLCCRFTLQKYDTNYIAIYINDDANPGRFFMNAIASPGDCITITDADIETSFLSPALTVKLGIPSPFA